MSKRINEDGLSSELGKAAAIGAAGAAGALGAQALGQLAARKLKRKRFRDTVTGQELLRRLQNAKDSLKELKAEKV